jgi:MFS family permease
MADAAPIHVRISRREWIVILLLVLSVVINYVDRSNLGLAMPLLERQFSFSSLRAGELLSAFFWTYALVQLFGLAGELTDRFPVGWVLLLGYLLWSTATAFIGLTTSYAALFALQLVLGLGESVAYPCYSRIFAAMPQEHRGRANAFIDAGTKLGPAAGAFVGGMVLVHWGWRMLFVVFGVGALAWMLPWYFAMPRGGSAVHSKRSAQERGAAMPAFGSTGSIAKMIRLRCAWGTTIGHFSGNYFYYFLLAWLPTYLVQEEHLSIRNMSRLTAAIFLLIACTTLLSGWISDRLIARGVSPTTVRLRLVVGGQAMASCLLALTLVHGHPLIALGLLAIACIGHGGYASNHWAIAQTLAGPAMAGRWSSLAFLFLTGVVVGFIAFFPILACGIGFPLALVAADCEQLRTYGVLGDEAVVIEGLEQRHAGDSLLCNELAEMARIERPEGFWRDDVARPLAVRANCRLQPALLDPGLDLRLAHMENIRQGVDRHPVTTNLADLEVVSMQRAANRFSTAAEHLSGLFDRVCSDVLAKRVDLGLGPAPMFVANLQPCLQHEPPAGFPRSASMPLQAANKLIEFLAGQDACLDGDCFGLIVPRAGGAPIHGSHWAPHRTGVR